MRIRNFIVQVLLLLAVIIFTPLGLAAPGDYNAIHELELFDLKKRGGCDSTKYTVINLESQSIITSHTFLNKSGEEVYAFTGSSIDLGETRTYDLSEMDGLPPNFIGDLLIASTGEIAGWILPFPPCEMSIECSPDLSNGAEISTSIICTATITPEDLLQPLTITWHEWNPIGDHRILGIGEEVIISWSIPGMYQIAIVAENPVGTIIDNFQIIIKNGINEVFIPLAIR